MNFSRGACLPRQMFPDLVRCKSQNRSQQTRQCGGDPVNGGLGRAAGAAPLRKGVEPGLENIEIKCGQVDYAEIIERVIDAMEVESFVELRALRYEAAGPGKHPAIHFL